MNPTDKSLHAKQIDLFVGQRLRSKRLIVGMTQSALGDKLGITFQQLQKYERGMNRISASRLYDASLLLQEPVSYFFAGLPGQGDHLSEKEIGNAVGMSSLMSSETVEILKLFFQVKNPKMRTQLLKMIKVIGTEF